MKTETRKMGSTPQGGSASAPAAKLWAFVDESNRIEGIRRAATDYEIAAHAAFMVLREVTVADMESFVTEVAARPLRRAVGQDVYVGNHRPPPGGPGIEPELRSILAVANAGDWTPYDVHVAYETLHPFMDGNGRSGRVLWAWQMRNEGLDPFSLPFLHRFYYQSLDGGRGA